MSSLVQWASSHAEAPLAPLSNRWVRFSRRAQQQAAHLSQTTRAAFADAVGQLRDDPWQGMPYRPGYPPEYRTLAFGEWGIVVDGGLVAATACCTHGSGRVAGV